MMVGLGPAPVLSSPRLSALEVVVLLEGKQSKFSSSSFYTCSRRLWGPRRRYLGGGVVAQYLFKRLDRACTSRVFKRKERSFLYT
jgi:hypothetical protein